MTHKMLRHKQQRREKQECHHWAPNLKFLSFFCIIWKSTIGIIYFLCNKKQETMKNFYLREKKINDQLLLTQASGSPFNSAENTVNQTLLSGTGGVRLPGMKWTSVFDKWYHRHQMGSLETFLVAGRAHNMCMMGWIPFVLTAMSESWFVTMTLIEDRVFGDGIELRIFRWGHLQL